jgi:hydrogenase maturation protease
MMREKVLIIGIGNFDRQDDGVAWHILQGINQKLGRTTRPTPYETSVDPEGDNPQTLFSLQIYPEMADLLHQYKWVCFVDAHTGAIEEDLSCQTIYPERHSNPLTHHMTPQTVLSLCATLHKQVPHAIIVSVRGYSFQYHQGLSEGTTALAKQAVDFILQWLSDE